MKYIVQYRTVIVLFLLAIFAMILLGTRQTIDPLSSLKTNYISSDMQKTDHITVYKVDHPIQYGAGYLLFEFQLRNGRTFKVVLSNQVNNENGIEVVLLSNGSEAYTVQWSGFEHLWDELTGPPMWCKSTDIPVL